MARPHSGHDAIIKYLKDGDFAWKQPLIAPPDHESFSAEQVKQSLEYVKICNPSKYKILDLTISTGRPRADIANALHLDTSTVKRYLNHAVDLLMIHLRYGNLIDNKQYLDLRNILQ
jgi:hypothetical protein